MVAVPGDQGLGIGRLMPEGTPLPGDQCLRGHEYCYKCGYPLNVKTFEEYKEKQSEALTHFQEFLVENPDVFEALKGMRRE